MKYIVTGATGQLGSLVLKQLKQAGLESDTIAVVRDEKKGNWIREQGFELRIADYNDQSSLLRAFNGGERLLFVSSLPGGEVDRITQHRHVVQAAKDAGIQFVVYTGLAHADESASILAPDHKATEKLIRESGIPFAILRNNWYLENEQSTLVTAVKSGTFTYGAGEGKVGWALRRDYAEAAANVLIGDANVEGVLELSGPAVTYNDLAISLEKLLDRKIEVDSLTLEEYNQFLLNNLPSKEAADGITAIQRDIRNGELDVERSDFSRVLNRPLTSLEEGLAEIIK